GFEYLIRAMREIDATLLLIGTGPLRGALESLAREMRVASKVRLLGRVENVVPYYRVSKLLVLPSIARAEGFGLVQVEAMAAGIPVVNTDLDSGVPEVSVHGVTGITVPARDTDALAQAVNLLLNNEETRTKYGRAAKVRAKEKFSARQMAEGTLELYKA